MKKRYVLKAKDSAPGHFTPRGRSAKCVELERWIVIVEVHDGLISQLKCSPRILTIGKYVYRFSRLQIVKLTSSLGTKVCEFRTFWN